MEVYFLNETSNGIMLEKMAYDGYFNPQFVLMYGLFLCLISGFFGFFVMLLHFTGHTGFFDFAFFVYLLGWWIFIMVEQKNMRKIIT